MQAKKDICCAHRKVVIPKAYRRYWRLKYLQNKHIGVTGCYIHGHNDLRIWQRGWFCDSEMLGWLRYDLTVWATCSSSSCCLLYSECLNCSHLVNVLPERRHDHIFWQSSYLIEENWSSKILYHFINAIIFMRAPRAMTLSDEAVQNYVVQTRIQHFHQMIM